MNDPKCCAFHYANITERACLIVHAIKRHQPGQAVIIQPADTPHTHAPLGSHGLKNLKRWPDIGPGFNDHRIIIGGTQAKSTEIFNGRLWRIKRFGKRYQFFPRAAISSRVNRVAMESNARG
ncbi:hypothetical protein SESI111939_12870 [Serratia silvae]